MVHLFVFIFNQLTDGDGSECRNEEIICSHGKVISTIHKSEGNRFKLFLTERFRYFVSVLYMDAGWRLTEIPPKMVCSAIDSRAVFGKKVQIPPDFTFKSGGFR